MCVTPLQAACVARGSVPSPTVELPWHDLSLAGMWLGQRDLAFPGVSGKPRMNRLYQCGKLWQGGCP